MDGTTPHGRRKHFVCSIDGCGRKHAATGLCAMHYQRERARRLGQTAPKVLAADVAARKTARLVRRVEREAEREAARVARTAARASRGPVDHAERRRERADSKRLAALYDHPATARLLRLLALHRSDLGANLDELRAAAAEIPKELRRFAFAIRTEFDPIWPVARAIARSGGETLEVVGELYGVSRERSRQIETSALAKLQRLPEVQALRNHLERDADPEADSAWRAA